MSDLKLIMLENLERAWTRCLEIPEFRMLLDYLGSLCSHNVPTTDPELRVRQQLFLEFLHSGELIDEKRPSFGYEYFTQLSSLRSSMLAERSTSEASPDSEEDPQ